MHRAASLTEVFTICMMSESRTSYYIAVALGQLPPQAWSNLGRVYASNHAGVGMLSWSGTAFEYFYADAVLSACRGYRRASVAALRRARTAERSISRVCGARARAATVPTTVTETIAIRLSAFPRLRSARAAESASILPIHRTLSCSAHAERHSKISRLREYGMYGRYGFYESLDLTPSRVGDGHAVVRSICRIIWA